MSFIKEYPGYSTISIRVTPRSSRAKVLGQSAGLVRIALTAPPVDNAANEALIEFLANTLQIAKKNISILKGHQSREKTVRIDELTPLIISQKLIGE